MLVVLDTNVLLISIFTRLYARLEPDRSYKLRATPRPTPFTRR